MYHIYIYIFVTYIYIYISICSISQPQETQSWQQLSQQHGLAPDVRFVEAVLMAVAAAPEAPPAAPAEVARRCFQEAKDVARVKRLGSNGGPIAG